METLEAAAALTPDDPLPRLYQALLMAQFEDSPACRERLALAMRLSPERASRLARRFFPETLEIYQGQAVIRLGPNRSWAGLANARQGWASAEQPPLDFGTIPLRDATYIFRWDPAEADFDDCTAAVQSRLELETAVPSAALPLLADPTRVRLHQLQPGRERGTFDAMSGDAFLTIERLSLDPRATPRLIIEAALTAGGPADNRAEIYWATARNQEFSEARKLSFSLPADGQTRSITIPLDRIVSILEARTITALRFDFSARPGRIKLTRLELAGPGPIPETE
jgi:hypothetical protein